MQLLDSAPEGAAENLALDEMLLGQGDEVLRFWESTTPVVVVGQSGRIAEQVRVDACSADGVSILRRCSGGGAVVLARGCLNYSFIFSLQHRPAWHNVRLSVREILGRMAAVLDVDVQAPADLSRNGRKVSGSAQRRTATALLHHGTILYSFDPELAERYLQPPTRQPAYRAGRTHRDFLGTVPFSAPELQQRIAKAWDLRVT